MKKKDKNTQNSSLMNLLIFYKLFRTPYEYKKNRLQNNSEPMVDKNTQNSVPPKNKYVIMTKRDKNTQNNPQNSYRQKHTKQSSEPI